MSHFLLYVIGDNPGEQLEPFYECSEDNRYREFVSTEEEYREEWEKDKDKSVADYASFEEYMEGIGYDKDEATGQYGYWTNPNGKWDWYSVGGRWTGFFRLKPDCDPENIMLGQSGAFRNTPEQSGEGLRSDQARKEAIDIEGMREECRKVAIEKYDKFEKIVEGIDPPTKTWEQTIDEFGEDNINQAQKAYNQHPWILAFRTSEMRSIWGDPVEKFFVYNGGRAAYVQHAVNQAFAPFAILKDGQWYEKGKMCSFGMVADEKEAEEWESQVNTLIDGLPGDTLITVVDCHS